MKAFTLLIFALFYTAIDCTPQNETSSKIIFLLPVASKSHKNVFEPLITALLDRGHKLTVVSPLKSPKSHPNLREIHPVSVEEINKSPALSGGNMFENRKKGKLASLLNFNNSFVNEVCHRFYQNDEVQIMLKTKEHFDLAFVNAVPNQCALGFVHHLSIPHINLGTLPLTNQHVASVGGYFPRSFVPSAFGPYLNLRNFSERVMNFITEFLSGLMYYQSQSAEVYRKYLGSETPSVSKIDRNASMVFMNTNFLLTFPRPVLPNIIEVGGMHCQERSSDGLPKDLKALLDNAKDGFIYFSLGSIVRTKNMPKDVRHRFLSVFSRLKQLVIWKWDNETEADLPPNVVVRKWLPQQNILSHPNIKLFITHGGLLSMQESVYYGIPLVGYPLYVDQDLNMKHAENLGLGLKLEITDFTEQELEDRVTRILSDQRFAEKAKQLSGIFRDQPQTPTQRAVYWSEYVIRHNGAHHLKSASRHLNAFQYHSIDVVAFLLVVFLCLLFILKVILANILRLIIFAFKKMTNTSSQKEKFI